MTETTTMRTRYGDTFAWLNAWDRGDAEALNLLHPTLDLADLVDCLTDLCLLQAKLLGHGDAAASLNLLRLSAERTITQREDRNDR